MKVIRICPICRSSELKTFLKTKDYFGDQETFELLQCRNCHGLSTSPQPSATEIIPFYKSNNYISHGNDSKSIISILYRIIQQYNFNYKKKIIQKYVLNKNILDYGCGTGHFLKYLSDQGWKTSGIEPDDQAQQLAINKGINILQIHELNDRYDCISLFHVLEHVHDIHMTVQILQDHLTSNGILILALPNYQSYDAKYYGKHWAGYDVPRHLYHFSQQTVHSLFEDLGLKILSTHPLYFDSYYVSILSEEYKHGKKNLVNGLWKGFQSNRKAKINHEYSSLIYILSK